MKSYISSLLQNLTRNNNQETTADYSSMILEPSMQHKIVRHCRRRFLRPWNPCRTCKYHTRVFGKRRIGKTNISIYWYSARCIFPDCPNSWLE